MNIFKRLQLMRPFSIKLTLQQKLAYFTLGAVVFLGLFLVLFINLIAPLFSIQAIGMPDTIVQIPRSNDQGTQALTTYVTPGPEGHLVSSRPLVISLDPLEAVKYLSIIGLIVISLLAIGISRWIAKTTLLPVVSISSVAKQIGAQNLSQRIDYSGANDELKALADSFDRMLERLQDNFETQSQFTSNLAHELRTPLTSLRMNLEVLRSDPQANLEDYQSFAASAERAIERLERLVSDLLLLSKAEKEVYFQKIILGVVFEDIFEELKPIVKQQKVTLRLVGDPEIEIMGDPVLIHRAFSNLIENGVFYNNPGGFVEIRLNRLGSSVVIEIVDNGIGISEDQQKHIFERFYRAGDQQKVRFSEGKGLGLAITAHILNLHGGKICVKSVPAKGSTFTITFQSANGSALQNISS